MTKDEYFKLCTALVQEQVYAWGIASSFVCLGSPPGMADAMLLKPNWSIPRVGAQGVHQHVLTRFTFHYDFRNAEIKLI